MSSVRKPPATTVELFLPLRRRLILTMRGSGLELFKTFTIRAAASAS